MVLLIRKINIRFYSEVRKIAGHLRIRTSLCTISNEGSAWISRRCRVSDNRNGEIEFPFVEEIEIETEASSSKGEQKDERRSSLKGREICY